LLLERMRSDNSLSVSVSENSRIVTGLEPDGLFELRCFTDLLINSDKKEFFTRVRGMKNQRQTSRTNPDVFQLSLTSWLSAPLPCFIAMHWNETANLIICEFELKNDVFNPRHHPTKVFQPMVLQPMVRSKLLIMKLQKKNAPCQQCPSRSHFMLCSFHVQNRAKKAL
jgi:hypothetical protein